MYIYIYTYIYIYIYIGRAVAWAAADWTTSRSLPKRPHPPHWVSRPRYDICSGAVHST